MLADPDVKPATQQHRKTSSLDLERRRSWYYRTGRDKRGKDSVEERKTRTGGCTSATEQGLGKRHPTRVLVEGVTGT